MGTWRGRLRDRLCEAQAHRCVYCGVKFTRGLGRATLEHYQAQAHGGKTTYRNCVAACQRCNAERGTENPQSFWVRKQGYRALHGVVA